MSIFENYAFLYRQIMFYLDNAAEIKISKNVLPSPDRSFFMLFFKIPDMWKHNYENMSYV